MIAHLLFVIQCSVWVTACPKPSECLCLHIAKVASLGMHMQIHMPTLWQQVLHPALLQDPHGDEVLKVFVASRGLYAPI